MTLKEQLAKYSKDLYPMYMPGHKGGRYRLIDDLYAIDLTEVTGTDYLYQATGILRESMKKLARIYGAKHSIYLVNGSTVGVLSAIGGLHRKGDKILMARNCHQSVYHAIALFGFQPCYIDPEITRWGLAGGIQPEKIEALLQRDKEIQSVVITSPTYEGFLSDIEEIVRVCHRYHVRLIVDEAHGAHLAFSDLLPKSAVELGADVVIQSMHKTLPTLTSSAIMHLNMEEKEMEDVVNQLEMLQTSSPSYIMMAQMDLCVKRLWKNESEWKRLLMDIKEMNQALDTMVHLKCLHDYKDETAGIFAQDPLKTVILTQTKKATGIDVSGQLREKHHIQMEMASRQHVLGIMSVADTKEALNNYAEALIAIDQTMKAGEPDYGYQHQRERANQIMRPDKALASRQHEVQVSQAVGEIAAEMITPYPPGIPLVVPGEEISENVVHEIRLIQTLGITLIGVEADKIQVVTTYGLTDRDEVEK